MASIPIGGILTGLVVPWYRVREVLCILSGNFSPNKHIIVMDISALNWWAVIVAGVAAWVIGAVWYAGPLFGKAWQKELGFTTEYLQEANMAKVFGSSLVLMILMAFGMAMFFGPETEMTWQEGATYGAMTGIFFVATSIGINYLYQRRSFKLWMIDALYQIIFLTVQGTIIGAWR